MSRDAREIDREVDADSEETLRQEIRKRLADLDSGAVTAIPCTEARAQLLGKLTK